MASAIGLGANSSPAKSTSTTAAVEGMGLTNPIHPIFRPENFVHSDCDLSVMEPALQLASRYLTTDALLPFWHTILFSGVKPIESLFYPQMSCEKGVYTDDSLELTQKQIQRTKEALKQFSDKVTFELLPPHCQSYTGGVGMWEDEWKQDTLHEGDDKIFQATAGIRARIVLDFDLYKSLCASHNSDCPRFCSSNHWSMARTLLHELAHAVVMVQRGEPLNFFPNVNVSEDGYDWETRTFGGLMIRHGSDWVASDAFDGYGGFVCFAWPNPRMVKHYISTNSCIGVREETGLKQLVWKVPFSYFKQFFMTSFWEVDVPLRGREALFARPEVAYEVTPHDDEQLTPIERKMELDEWFPLIAEPMGAKR